MDFYLARHGEAKSESEDPRRPLSPRGRRGVEGAARAAAAKGIRVFEIFHSDKLRAKETAEILARYLSPAAGVREARGLGPEDDPRLAKVQLESADDSLMLVGHLPHLGRLASLLLTGDPARESFDLPAAAILCLAQDEGQWVVRWIVTAETA